MSVIERYTYILALPLAAAALFGVALYLSILNAS